MRPSASYPVVTLGDSINRRQPVFGVAPLRHPRHATSELNGPYVPDLPSIVDGSLRRLAGSAGLAVHQSTTAGTDQCALAMHAGGNARNVRDFA